MLAGILRMIDKYKWIRNIEQAVFMLFFAIYAICRNMLFLAIIVLCVILVTLIYCYKIIFLKVKRLFKKITEIIKEIIQEFVLEYLSLVRLVIKYYFRKILEINKIILNIFYDFVSLALHVIKINLRNKKK